MSETIRVISYNLLSSSLSDPSYLVGSDKEDCDPEIRYSKCLAKLEEEMGKEAILCLQEVSQNWTGRLHVFFAKHDYCFIPSLYGNNFDGYMGIAIAFPNHKYELFECEMVRVSETQKLPKSEYRSRNKTTTGTLFIPSILYSFSLNSSNFVRQFLPRWLGGLNMIEAVPANDEKYYLMAGQRRNTLINLRLGVRTEDGETPTFCVSTYHMPCSYDKPKMMVIHASMVAKQVKKFAEDSPYIFCGDFNSEPTSSVYQLLTGGNIKEEDTPIPPPSVSWNINLKEGMKSAYKECLGEEPEYTIVSKTSKTGEFIGCLDYIFIDSHCKTLEVIELAPYDEETIKYCPCAEEPSDHYMIGADIEISFDT